MTEQYKPKMYVECMECGAMVESFEAFYWLNTGRVHLDGKDVGQAANLCAEHYPTRERWWQPQNCTRVKFYWGPDNPEMNE